MNKYLILAAMIFAPLLLGSAKSQSQEPTAEQKAQAQQDQEYISNLRAVRQRHLSSDPKFLGHPVRAVPGLPISKPALPRPNPKGKTTK